MERWFDNYVSDRMINPNVHPLESRKSSENLRQRQNRGNDNLASTVNEPFASMFTTSKSASVCEELEECLLRQLSSTPRPSVHPRRSASLPAKSHARAPAIVHAIVGAFAFTEVAGGPLQQTAEHSYRQRRDAGRKD